MTIKNEFGRHLPNDDSLKVAKTINVEEKIEQTVSVRETVTQLTASLLKDP